ncbi:hypothetical protein PILCRDRAFT_814783 [Piloderma croceum F 1598]|uniref:TERF2-interacting telomeric protein 1 Myb domain-containing protein n=1 Tax=Piloderma croceum (strain F 1598) TaxID=765440 RepID=A0A0C3G668_PILCF|nr:hypothetical protein PILCRDRAFT_814783 [Piloderma croceum F 1598]
MYNPEKVGRQGNAIYQRLEANENGRWKWAARHPWQSWRERYKNKQPWFDQQITRYQQKKGIKSENSEQKVIIRKKAARRRDAVDEGQTEEEEELRKSERDRDAERKRKRKRIEEQADRERKKAKKGNADPIEIRDGQVRAQKNSGVGGSSSKPRRADSDEEEEEEEEEEESEEERKGPAGPDDYSAEIFADEADEIVEDSENVGPEENGDTSQDDGDEHTEDPGLGSPDKAATSQSRNTTASPRKSIISVHSTSTDSGPLYPDLSVLPSPIVSSPNNEERQLPGAFDPPIKHELPTQDKLEPDPSPHNSHPSQEPTPPLSNVDERSPRQDNSGTVLSNTRRGGSQKQYSGEPVFPGGDYRVGLPVRTDTLVLQDVPSKSDPDVADKPDIILPTKSKSKLNLKKRRRSSAGGGSSDFFESFPPTPGSNRDVRVAREAPQLIDGPFGNAFTDGRGKAPKSANGLESSEDEGDEDEGVTRSDEQQWPPRRTSNKQTNTKGKANAEDDEARLSQTRVPTTAEPSKPNGGHHPFTQPTQEYDAVMAQYFATNDNHVEASSSETHHDTHHPFSQPSQAVGWNDSTTTNNNQTTSTSHTPMQPRKQYRAFIESLPDPDKLTTSSTHIKVGDSKTRRVYVPPTSVGPSSSRTGFLRPSDHYLHVGSARTSVVPQLPMSSRASSSDPFLVPEVPRRKHDSEGKDKEKSRVRNNDRDRRKTFGGLGAHPAIPKIDLTLRTKRPHRRIFLPPRQSLPAQRTAASMDEFIPPRRVSAPVEDPNAPSSASSSPSNMSATDHSIAVRLGIDTMLQKMSDNHGFTLDVVRRLYDLIGDFQRTDAALMRMRHSAEEEATSFINMDVNPVDRQPRTSHHSSPRRVLYPFPGLEYTPVAPDSGNLSDYTPPEASRAGRYARLAREGRRHEALKQEGKRVSIGGTGPFLQNIRMSEGSFSGGTPGPLMGSVDRQFPESASASIDRKSDVAVDMVSPSPQQPIWGDEEDRLLRSGDPVVLKKLEAKMGKASFKQRTAEINLVST